MSNGQVNPMDPVEFDRLFALESEGAPEPKPQEPATAAPVPAAEGGKETGAAPVETPQGVEAPAAAQEGEAAQQPGLSEQDWRAALPEDVRKRIDEEIARREQALQEAEDRYKALHGKVAPVQRRLSEVERQLAAYQTVRAQQVPPVSQPAQPSPGQSLESYFDSTEWKEYESTFPADAKVLRQGLEAQYRAQQQIIASLDSKINQLAQRLEQAEVVVTDTSLARAIAQLEERHKDWREINESDEFWNWLDDWRAAQPKALRDIYYDESRLGELMRDPDFVSDLLDRYKAQQTQPESAAPVTAPATQPNSAQPAQTPRVDPRLQMSVAPEVRGHGAVPAAVDISQLPPEQQFDYLWKNGP